MTITTTTGAVEYGVGVIAAGQSSSGAYIASPNFPEYRFGWLRDGAYCSLAMDAAAGPASAAAFHAWVARVLTGQRSRIEAIVSRLRAGDIPHPSEMLPTRYTLDGEPEVLAGEAWPNFQLDGYGTWLFALHSHLAGRPVGEHREAAALAAEYIAACWRLPCFDYWEEFGDRRHTATLAAIAAGLRAASRLLGESRFDSVAVEILAWIEAECVVDGSFVKGPEDDRVDASLVSLSTPFGLFAPQHPVMARTIERIRTELSSPSGGILRYRGDTYYGGNPWLLLTAWLGWHDRISGNETGYIIAREWVLSHAGADGDLVEQILHEPQDESFVQPWIDRWGPVANPLLWSHAKFILMQAAAPRATWN